MFIILNWDIPENVLPIMEEDGTPMFFDSEEEATKHAEKELNFEWKVVEL